MSLRVVLGNSVWLIADKVVRLGLGLVVWLWLARHFGPVIFGQWSFSIAYVALFGAIAALGFDGVVQRELLNHPGRDAEIVGTSLVLLIVSGVCMAAASVLLLRHFVSPAPVVVALVACNAATLPLQGAQAVNYFFQARSQSRYAVWALNGAFLISSVLRVAMLWRGNSLVWLAGTLVLENLLAALMLLGLYRAKGSQKPWMSFSIDTAKELISQSWPLLLSGIAVMIYMRIDQVMLAVMAGDAAVGQFSAALRISEVWYFIPLSIVTAAFPVMMQKRTADSNTYESYVQRLYDLMAWLGVAVAIVVSLVAPWLVNLLYGPAFGEAARVLSIQTWAGVAVSMSYVHGKWLLAERMQGIGLVYTAVGLCTNLCLNMLLIPRYGAVGAAVSTLVTQMGPIPIQLFFAKGRTNLRLMVCAFAAPVRYVLR